ncbi:MAG: hypothetical protein JW901_05300 [Dehalococcoidia bacterium]|nr:hypothetical protein [Dehalococcoidia bacterium]
MDDVKVYWARQEEADKALLLSVEIELQGMLAENMQREKTGQSMAYVYDDFAKLRTKLQ